MAKKRNEIKKDDKWNVEAIFKSDKLWEKELKVLEEDMQKIIQFKGKLEQSAIIIKNMIETNIELDRRLDKLFIYAHMKNDEDLKNEKNKKYYELAHNIYIEYSQISSWIIPEIIKIDDNKMNKYINSHELLPYQFYLQKILRTKKHTLSENEEKILSMAANALTTASDGFKSLNDGDLKFGEIIDNKNNKLELTHSLYNLYLINKDRGIREKAFKQYHNKYDEFPMTLASLLYGKIKEHHFYSNNHHWYRCCKNSQVCSSKISKRMVKKNSHYSGRFSVSYL